MALLGRYIPLALMDALLMSWVVSVFVLALLLWMGRVSSWRFSGRGKDCGARSSGTGAERGRHPRSGFKKLGKLSDK